MRILHLITSLDCGGAEKMLVKVIKDSKHDHHVVSLKPRGVIADEILGSTYYVGWKVWQIYKLIKTLNPDVLITWLYHADLIGLILGKLAGVPKIIWNIRCSDMRYHIWNYQWWLRKTCSWLSDVPDMVIINSRQSRIFHQKIGYHPKKWMLIHNGFDTKKFMPYLWAKEKLKDELNLQGDIKFIGMVARYHPMKDHRTFIKAAVQLLNTRKDVHFILVGNGVGKESLIAPGDNIPRFHLLGERHDLPLVFPAFDVFCMTSAYGEGFPNVVGEAMSCGVPCVVTDVGDAAYLVEDTGYVTEPKNYKRIANACLAILDGNRDFMPRERIKRFFSIETVREKYEAVYT